MEEEGEEGGLSVLDVTATVRGPADKARGVRGDLRAVRRGDEDGDVSLSALGDGLGASVVRLLLMVEVLVVDFVVVPGFVCCICCCAWSLVGARVCVLRAACCLFVACCAMRLVARRSS